ncbi:MAG: heavy-metal-associated domain-containing protein, partial [Oscillospiraceae bacterium]|nr:heavy-metal-associated domain-containing protein [Oscillospiraceae bacterium]
MRVIYRVEHLHCPRCAVRIEERLRQLPQIEAVCLSFSASQLHLTVSDTENLLEQVQAAAREIDEGIHFLDKEHAGHHHAKDYAQEMQKFKCSDPNCKCCDYLPEKETPVPEDVPE